jgi:hypothetical protein
MHIFDLWLPILLGGLVAWIASALIHMALKYHNSDYRQLANEDAVRAAIRSANPARGVHSVPHCVDMAQMNDEGMQAKFREGPVALVTVLPNGMPNMGKLIGQQFAFFVLGCTLVAYCATLALVPGADGMAVFRFVSATSFLAFGWAVIPYSIWYGHSWTTTAKYLLDALIYGVVVGACFAWLWPATT